MLARDVERLRESLGPFPEPVARPALVVLTGLPGTGKSHFVRRLAERLPLLVLESDALRKVLAPRPTYSPEESRRLFDASHIIIEVLLDRGIRVAFDATNLSEAHREGLYDIADRAGAKLVIVRVRAPEELVRQRLARRTQGLDSDDKSEADWAVYRRMKLGVERIGRRHFVVDTARDIGPALDRVVREATRQ